jgi:hypothetical protein
VTFWLAETCRCRSCRLTLFWSISLAFFMLLSVGMAVMGVMFDPFWDGWLDLIPVLIWIGLLAVMELVAVASFIVCQNGRNHGCI